MGLTAATTNVFLVVFQLAKFFLSAFRLMLKIFSLVAKFRSLGSRPSAHIIVRLGLHVHVSSD